LTGLSVWRGSALVVSFRFSKFFLDFTSKRAAVMRGLIVLAGGSIPFRIPFSHSKLLALPVDFFNCCDLLLVIFWRIFFYAPFVGLFVEMSDASSEPESCPFLPRCRRVAVAKDLLKTKVDFAYA